LEQKDAVCLHSLYDGPFLIIKHVFNFGRYNARLQASSDEEEVLSQTSTVTALSSKFFNEQPAK
jgi:hypothetical protein